MRMRALIFFALPSVSSIFVQAHIEAFELYLARFAWAYRTHVDMLKGIQSTIATIGMRLTCRRETGISRISISVSTTDIMMFTHREQFQHFSWTGTTVLPIIRILSNINTSRPKIVGLRYEALKAEARTCLVTGIYERTRGLISSEI